MTSAYSNARYNNCAFMWRTAVEFSLIKEITFEFVYSLISIFFNVTVLLQVVINTDDQRVFNK